MFHLHLQWPLKCNNCDWPAPWLLQKYAGAAWKQNRKTQFLVIGDYNYDTLIKKYLWTLYFISISTPKSS